MTNYKEMYSKLFNKITDIIEELQQIQQQTEELYIHGDEVEVVILEQKNDEKNTHLTN